jgi:hypothetical protein
VDRSGCHGAGVGGRRRTAAPWPQDDRRWRMGCAAAVVRARPRGAGRAGCPADGAGRAGGCTKCAGRGSGRNSASARGGAQRTGRSGSCTRRCTCRTGCGGACACRGAERARRSGACACGRTGCAGCGGTCACGEETAMGAAATAAGGATAAAAAAAWLAPAALAPPGAAVAIPVVQLSAAASAIIGTVRGPRPCRIVSSPLRRALAFSNLALVGAVPRNEARLKERGGANRRRGFRVLRSDAQRRFRRPNFFAFAAAARCQGAIRALARGRGSTAAASDW